MIAKKRRVLKVMDKTFIKKSNVSQGVRTIIVESDYSGQRLDNYLQRELKGVPKSRIYRIIRKGEVRINGKRVQASTRLVAGDKLRVPPIRKSIKLPARQVKLNLEKTIIYENNIIIVINKPSGIAVHGGSGVSMGVIETLRANYATKHSLELVHRLDRDTSGCLMIAKNRRYLKALQVALRSTSVINKHYRAVVHGNWPHRLGSIEAPIAKNVLSSGERISRVLESGKVAKTEFNILARGAGLTLLAVKAITGRTHQIRVHCSHAKHPIVGDTKYGDSDEDKRLAQTLGFGRLLLHAERLEVPAIDDFSGFCVTAPQGETFSKILEYISANNTKL